MSADQELKKVYIFFKKITNAPVIERSLDYCSDVSYLCSNKKFQHVEIGFKEKDSFVTYLATSNYNIIRVTRDYTFIDNEGFYICYSIKVPKKDLHIIKEYCEYCVDTTSYDFSSIYFLFNINLSYFFKKKDSHSCSSLCFVSILQSSFIRNIILRYIFNNNESDLTKTSHSTNPNIIFTIIKKLITLSKEGMFKGLIIAEKEKLSYIYDYSGLNKAKKIMIKTSDDFFISEQSEEDL